MLRKHYSAKYIKQIPCDSITWYDVAINIIARILSTIVHETLHTKEILINVMLDIHIDVTVVTNIQDDNVNIGLGFYC